MNDKKQKKILIVTNFYKPHISGITTYIDQLLSSFILDKNFVTILTIHHSLELSRHEKFKNYEIIRCKPFLKISRGFISIELISLFFKIYKKYDLINVHFPLVEIFALIFFLKKNTIFNYHCLPHFNFLYKFMSFYFVFYGFIGSLLSKKIIVLSKDYFQETILYRINKKKIIEIPPYIKPIKVNNYYSSKTNNEVFTIGFIGRICPEKGLEYLIKASEILKIKNINHLIKIAGNTKDSRFQNYINKLKKMSKSNQNIFFLGNINEKDKEDFYRNIDVLVLPSVNSFEAFGIVQLEAMSFGTPVISSNLRGVRTVINNTGNGLIFKKNDYHDLVDKIIEVKNNFKKNRFEVLDVTLQKYSQEKFKNSVLNHF